MFQRRAVTPSNADVFNTHTLFCVFFFLRAFIDAVYSEADRQTGAGARIQRHTITHTNTHMHASPKNGLRLVPAFTQQASFLFDTPDPFPLFFQSSSPSRPRLYVADQIDALYIHPKVTDERGAEAWGQNAEYSTLLSRLISAVEL